MSVIASTINNNDSIITQLVTPIGVTLTQTPSLTPYPGCVAYDNTTQQLMFSNGQIGTTGAWVPVLPAQISVGATSSSPFAALLIPMVSGNVVSFSMRYGISGTDGGGSNFQNQTGILNGSLSYVGTTLNQTLASAGVVTTVTSGSGTFTIAFTCAYFGGNAVVSCAVSAGYNTNIRLKYQVDIFRLN